jgi:gamma-aminobutyric acid receptor subunit beta
MAWCVFWIDPQYLPTQVGLSTASVFSLIAFRFSLRALLPKVDYMTYLDEFVLATTILVFLALGQAITTGRLAKIGHESLADRIDVWSRSIYLVAFALLIVFTLRLHF